MTTDLVVHVKIVKNPLYGEVRANQTLRYGTFNVYCCACKEILIEGKRFSDDSEEELIWKAIRQHATEHQARGDMRT